METRDIVNTLLVDLNMDPNDVVKIIRDYEGIEDKDTSNKEED